jgi:hypothetical protein
MSLRKLVLCTEPALRLLPSVEGKAEVLRPSGLPQPVADRPEINHDHIDPHHVFDVARYQDEIVRDGRGAIIVSITRRDRAADRLPPI